MRRENANSHIVYALCVREAGEKLQSMEVSSNERPGISPSCQDKEEGLGCWLCYSRLYPEGLPSESLYMGGSLFPPSSLQSHSLPRQKVNPRTQETRLGHSGFVRPSRPINSPKACVLLCSEEISLLKRKGTVIVKTCSNEVV